MSDHSSAALPGEHLQRLRTAVRGEVFLPGDADWDAARQAWQLLVDQHPAAVVLAADVHDVVAVVSTARRLGLRVAPQSTGHAAGAIRSLENTVLLRTSGLKGVSIDPETARARVGAGAVWADVVSAAAEYNLAAVAGMAPSVGVVGFSLGGGIGWLARSHGLAANSIVEFEAVDAHGRIVTVDAARHADLFWAARGGVAPVIVTSVVLQLHAIGELTAGAMLWPLERAADVAHAWREWVQDIPDTVTSLARVLRYPPIPEIPEPLRGRSFVSVEAAVQADAATAAALLQPLRDLAPALDTVRPMSPAELGSVHGDPPQPAPGYGDSIVVAEITAETIDAMLTAALAPTSAPLLSIEMRHLGGKLTPGRADGGVVSGIEGAGLVFAVGIVPVPELHEPVRQAAGAVIDALLPYAAASIVKNFAERPVEPELMYGEATERVRRIVAAWDPESIIRVAHPLD
jgi:FAD/FMN-containing dehydrogenase